MLKSSKILIAYFSHSGTTAKAARVAVQKTDGALFEIKTVEEYPEKYTEVVDIAKKEKNENKRPELKDKVKDMGGYEAIILAYPNWWGTTPMGVCTFLESYDLAGKMILPICTHGGGGLGHSVEDIKKMCPKSKVHDGLAIADKNIDGARITIEQWLTTCGV